MIDDPANPTYVHLVWSVLPLVTLTVLLTILTRVLRRWSLLGGVLGCWLAYWFGPFSTPRTGRRIPGLGARIYGWNSPSFRREHDKLRFWNPRWCGTVPRDRPFVPQLLRRWQKSDSEGFS
jgi:hypothetical protein